MLTEQTLMYTELGVAISLRLGLPSTILTGTPVANAEKFFPPPETWQVAGRKTNPPIVVPGTLNSPYCAAMIWPSTFCARTRGKQETMARTTNSIFFISRDCLVKFRHADDGCVRAGRPQVDKQRR